MQRSDSHYEFRDIDRLLKDISPPIGYLSRSFRIPGMQAEDIRQEIYKVIIETYQKDPRYYGNRKDGFWFIRARWHLLNIRGSVFKRDVLTNSISIDALFIDGEIIWA